jgi:hypothetical protein
VIWKREPVLFLSVVQTVVALAVSFGLDFTAEQVGAITAASAAVLGLVARRAVTPVE